MKLLSTRRDQGSMLVLTLVIGVTIGTVLASYLTLIGSRYNVTLRSQCWNAAMPVLEAGIEEAITHFHEDHADPAANDWTPGIISGQQVYWKTRTFPDGSYFLVHIYNASSNSPTIYSTGFVPAPLDPGNYVSRTVRVTGSVPPLFNVALGARYRIDMNGNGLATDSFNSSDPALSTDGQYSPAKTSTNGNVVNVYGPVDFGNHNILGSLSLGPSASSTVSPDQVSGGITTDFNASYPDVELPETTWLPALTRKIGKDTAYDFTTSGDYYVTGSSDIIVEPGVNVRVRVDATSFNPDSIHILSSKGVSGSLVLYQVSGTATMNGKVVVESGQARNFYYYGLPGVTSVTYDGSSTFIGVIYAPQADLTLNGGGIGSGVVGASISNSIRVNGIFKFHYDEELLTHGPTRGFVAASWREL